MEFSFIEQVLIALYILVTVGYFSWAMFIRLRMAFSAGPDGEKEGAGKALVRFVKEVIFQSKVIRDRPVSGILHAFVFWGFILYIPATIHHFLKPFTGGYLHGDIGAFYRTIMVVVSFLVAFSILALAFRRFILRPKFLGEKLSGASAVVAAFIFILMVTYIIEPFLADDALVSKANWFVHASCVLLFLVVIPHSKHLHLVIGPIDLLMMRKKFGQIPPFVIDIENFDEDMSFGIGAPTDAGREIRLDSLSCVECGRCTEWCPANRLDKALDPRSLIHNLEKPLLKGSTEPLFEDTIQAEAVWQCVTCGACEHFCPLGVQHLPLIMQYRRNLTLEQTVIPETMVGTFRALQTKGNVWLTDRERRAELIEEFELPAYEYGKILFWSSCFFLTPEFGPTVKRIVNLLNQAGIEAAISPDEICCGDPARKCGSEDLFQELAMQNIEWMKAGEVKAVVSDCPHCLQTLAEAYPQLDPEFKVEVIHHSEVLARLVRSGDLKISPYLDGKLTIHDPCYSSRWGFGSVQDVRSIAEGCEVGVVEMPLSGRKSYCCGSGGGAHHFFEDADQIRIDNERVRQIRETGANTVITSCPFCHNMISEGLKQEEANPIKVLDISDLVEI